MAYQRLDKSKRALILATLAEGAAINSICRMFRASKPNVLRFLCEAGKACEDWHNRHFRNLSVARIECDEQWSYVHTHKERMTKEEKARNPDRGDCWLWLAIDPDSKAVLSWLTGKRTAQAARTFAYDLAARVDGRVQITTDPLNSYVFSITAAFGERVDLAQETKVFQSSKVPGHVWEKFRADPLVGVERESVQGDPNLDTATVCHVERFFLTVRQSNKRCARKTLAYSKSWDNHALIASVQTFIYNLARRHETTKKTPAMALGVVERRWSLEDVVTMVDEYLRAQDDAKFEAAFVSKFSDAPTSRRTYEPRKPKTPWYLDPESGGPNPLFKKPGIAYDPNASKDAF
jgi:IS1 family transposase